jgi:hypothetical protein
MRQLKLFKGVEMDLATLEGDVNGWIQKNKVTVHKITGNIAPQAATSKGQDRMSGSDVLIVVEYER